MAGNNVHEFTDDNFKNEVLSAEQPVLVDFWAEWCMPCRMLGPTIDKLAGEFNGKVKVGKVDTDKSRNISVDYKITAIPTVMIFKGGQMKKKFVGLAQEGDLRKALDEVLVSP